MLFLLLLFLLVMCLLDLAGVSLCLQLLHLLLCVLAQHPLLLVVHAALVVDREALLVV